MRQRRKYTDEMLEFVRANQEGITRQAQAGHKRPVFIYHIIAKDTVDELIMERRDTKRSVQDILLNAMKRKYL